MTTTVLRFLLAGALAIAGNLASALEAATDQVILTISGAITETNDGQTARFDRSMLENLGAEAIETSTIWTDGPQTFVGVPLDVLLEAVGAQGTSLKATAINDYAVDIPVSDAIKGGPIVAYLRNGMPMSVREKGPLWIIYPFDSSPDYQSELVYSRSIWQLDRIEVQP